jgi:hypothetical protein
VGQREKVRARILELSTACKTNKHTLLTDVTKCLCLCLCSAAAALLSPAALRDAYQSSLLIVEVLPMWVVSLKSEGQMLGAINGTNRVQL